MEQSDHKVERSGAKLLDLRSSGQGLERSEAPMPSAEQSGASGASDCKTDHKVERSDQELERIDHKVETSLFGKIKNEYELLKNNILIKKIYDKTNCDIAESIYLMFNKILNKEEIKELIKYENKRKEYEQEVREFESMFSIKNQKNDNILRSYFFHEIKNEYELLKNNKIIKKISDKTDYDIAEFIFLMFNKILKKEKLKLENELLEKKMNFMKKVINYLKKKERLIY